MCIYKHTILPIQNVFVFWISSLCAVLVIAIEMDVEKIGKINIFMVPWFDKIKNKQYISSHVLSLADCVFDEKL